MRITKGLPAEAVTFPKKVAVNWPAKDAVGSPRQHVKTPRNWLQDIT